MKNPMCSIAVALPATSGTTSRMHSRMPLHWRSNWHSNWHSHALCALLLSIAAVDAAAAGSVKPIYVEEAIPSRPYMVSFDVLTAGFFGPATGVLGITSITFTNFGTGTRAVAIRQKVVVGPTCDSASVPQSTAFELPVYLEPRATVHLTFPSPLVLYPINGYTCLSSSQDGPGSVSVLINGFVN